MSMDHREVAGGFEMGGYYGTRQITGLRLQFGRRRDGGYIILRNQS